jgi:hypothetical protein
MKGEFKLAWGRPDGLGIYAAARISAEWGKTRGLELIGVERSAQNWAVGIRFGIELLRECLSRASVDDSGLRLEIVNFGGEIGDTTNMAAAYVTFHAASKAIGIDFSRVFEFDENNGQFRFLGVGLLTGGK